MFGASSELASEMEFGFNKTSHWINLACCDLYHYVTRYIIQD